MVYHTCWRVFDACGDERAVTVLQAAGRIVQHYARHIENVEHRERFLAALPNHQFIE